MAQRSKQRQNTLNGMWPSANIILVTFLKWFT